jgi:hypothetical protein
MSTQTVDPVTAYANAHTRLMIAEEALAEAEEAVNTAIAAAKAARALRNAAAAVCYDAEVAMTSAAKPAPVTERSVNAALFKAGIPVTIKTQKGYRSLQTIDPNGPEVDSIFVCYWHHMSLEQWVETVAHHYADAITR